MQLKEKRKPMRPISTGSYFGFLHPEKPKQQLKFEILSEVVLS